MVQEASSRARSPCMTGVRYGMLNGFTVLSLREHSPIPREANQNGEDAEIVGEVLVDWGRKGFKAFDHESRTAEHADVHDYCMTQQANLYAMGARGKCWRTINGGFLSPDSDLFDCNWKTQTTSSWDTEILGVWPIFESFN